MILAIWYQTEEESLRSIVTVICVSELYAYAQKWSEDVEGEKEASRIVYSFKMIWSSRV